MAAITQHWSYDLLKEIAINEASSSRSINELKSMFVNDIASPRRYECIHTIAELFDCLERRDVINEKNVDPLKLFRNKELDEAIANYQAAGNINKVENINEYHTLHLANDLSAKLSINNNHGSRHRSPTVHATNSSLSTINSYNADDIYPFALSEKKRNAIYKMLSQHLGTHWRSFGRELGLREGAMDEIELQYPRDLGTRVYKVMKAFEDDDGHDPKMYLRIIKEALENARRKDLRRKVDDIISH